MELVGRVFELVSFFVTAAGVVIIGSLFVLSFVAAWMFVFSRNVE